MPPQEPFLRRRGQQNIGMPAPIDSGQNEEHNPIMDGVKEEIIEKSLAHIKEIENHVAELKDAGLTPIESTMSPVNDWQNFLDTVDKCVRGVGMNRQVMFAFWHINSDNKLVMDRSTFSFPHVSFNEALVQLNRDLVKEVSRK